MGKAKEVAQMLFGFIVLAGLAWAGWAILTQFVEAFREADATVTAAVIGGIATVAVGLSVTLYTQNQTKSREIDKYLGSV